MNRAADTGRPIGVPNARSSMSKSQKKDPLMEFALIGARVKLAELEQAVHETKELIRLLTQGARTATKPKPADGRRKGKRRKHSDAFKKRVVEQALKHGISSTAGKYGLSRSLVDKWVAKAKASAT